MRIADAQLRAACDAFPVTVTEQDLVEVALDLLELRAAVRAVREARYSGAGALEESMVLSRLFGLVATPGESAAKEAT